MQEMSQSKREMRAALWSVYYHTFYLQTLRRSILEVGRLPFRPIPLDRAIQIIVAIDDAQQVFRQRRVLEKLRAAGLTNRARLAQLRLAAQAAGDPEWLKKVNDVERQVGHLANALNIDLERPVDRANRNPGARSRTPRASPRITQPCETTDGSCVACQVPNLAPTGRPATTVTARAILSQTPEQLAHIFDPRSWGICFDHFETHRVEERVGGSFPPHTSDVDPIGGPWTGSQLFFERVTIEEDGHTNVFDNILQVTSFTVTPTRARLDFDLRESRRLSIPALGLDTPECVTIDKGHMEAVLLPGPAGSPPRSQVEMVKTAQFVDLTLQGANNPLGLDPGEILNYLAPASLCLWLEDLTQGAVCCQV